MSEISSGLVAPHDHPDFVGGIVWSECELAWINKRISDAEAIIAQKDAEILDQCRLNGMGAEREATLIGKVAQQSAALNLAREALERSSKRDIAQWHNWDFDGDDDGKPPTQLNDPVLQAQLQAIAAVDEVLKGE